MNTCFVCKQPLYQLGIFKGYRILKCKACGMGYTVQGRAQSVSYHRDETYIEEEMLFKNIFEKRVNILSRLKKKGNVLEVGSSTGLMLSLLQKKGWDVTGIEISRKSAEAAIKRGIKVIVVPFQKARLNEKYDLIIFNHTFEHLEEPDKVLAKAYILLKRDGLIYIDLPNFDGFSAKLLGTRWPLLLPDEHLWHFTEKSLTLLLKGAGFKEIYIEKSSGIWDYENPLVGIIYSLLNFKKRFFIEFLTAFPSWIISKLQLGSDLLIVSKKL